MGIIQSLHSKRAAPHEEELICICVQNNTGNFLLLLITCQIANVLEGTCLNSSCPTACHRCTHDNDGIYTHSDGCRLATFKLFSGFSVLYTYQTYDQWSCRAVLDYFYTSSVLQTKRRVPIPCMGIFHSDINPKDPIFPC